MTRFARIASTLALICLSLGLLQGCDKSFCNPLTSKKATVKLQGKADLPQAAAVTLNGVKIGEVSNAAIDGQGKPTLTLCLDKKGFESLRKITVFYVNKEGAGATLAAEPLPDDATPPGDDPVFLGFDSYSTYLSWRTEHIVKKGFSDLLKAIDGALQ